MSPREHTRSELQRKLLRGGTPETVQEILCKLEQQGLLNDRALAHRRGLARRKIRLWGKHKIASDLKRLGIDARIVEWVLEQVEVQRSEAETLRQLVERWVTRHGKPEKIVELKKLYDHCFRLGYGSALIREHLSVYFDNTGQS